MKWTSQRSSAVIFGVGVVLIAISVAFPDVVIWDIFAVGIGGVYATTAAMFTLYELFGARDDIPFTYALLVALMAVAIGYSLEAIQWASSFYGDSIVDFISVLWAPYGVTSFVVAFLSPYTIAESSMQRKKVNVIVGLVFVLMININLYTSDSFIPGLSLIYVLSQIVVGLMVGLPMYLYTWSLRSE
ncbi:hypothetical protein SAMN05216388_11101 [Halorientalis persicus]|uniref:Uncharacterized protein n=1 Tax=Halorientalis persicus TaxID=1367881 RepID=A0A1H8X3E4_9EURY|nr:hypothetical protein [Halorientalis persicus]SEP34426.1 hypothetical protein SAMN05216388_11101 [Halorientalis persicus]